MQAIRDITPAIWPNAKVMASEIGHDYEKVRKWLQRGRIPVNAWPSVIQKSNGALDAEKLMRLNRRKRKG